MARARPLQLSAGLRRCGEGAVLSGVVEADEVVIAGGVVVGVASDGPARWPMVVMWLPCAPAALTSVSAGLAPAQMLWLAACGRLAAPMPSHKTTMWWTQKSRKSKRANTPPAAAWPQSRRAS